MYRSMASRVAGSSQLSGRWTVRLGTTRSVVAGSASSISRTRSRALRSGSRVGVDVQLQRADARREVDDAAQPVVVDAVLHLLRERVHPHPGGQVEGHRAVLDEQVVVAAAAVGDLRCRCPCGARMPPSSWAVRVGRGVACGRRAQRVRLGLVDRHEPHRVARAQLAQLPQLAERDGRRAREPAERRAVGAEQDRQVARVVDRADRVRGVVDVRRVQAGLAAVGSRPGGLGADEPDARARAS